MLIGDSYSVPRPMCVVDVGQLGWVVYCHFPNNSDILRQQRTADQPVRRPVAR